MNNFALTAEQEQPLKTDTSKSYGCKKDLTTKYQYKIYYYIQKYVWE